MGLFYAFSEESELPVHPLLHVLQFVPMTLSKKPSKFSKTARTFNAFKKTPSKPLTKHFATKTPIRSTSVPGMSIAKLSKLVPTASSKFTGGNNSVSKSFSNSKSASSTIHRPAKPSHGPSPIPKKLPGEFPMRINKYLGWKGYSTRRGADDLIMKHMVTINGRFATLGDQVTESDTIEVRNTRKPESYSYYAYNKPRGVSTDPTRKGTVDISQSIPLNGMFPVGGLDTNAEGLVILTNDRRITDRLLNPVHEHVKEFLIQTITPLRANFKEKMESGVVIGDSKPLHYSTKIISDNLCTVRLTDSGSHLRQMCSMFFAEIESLKRTQIMNITLGKLTPNAFRKIEGEELTGFLRALGL